MALTAWFIPELTAGTRAVSCVRSLVGGSSCGMSHRRPSVTIFRRSVSLGGSSARLGTRSSDAQQCLRTARSGVCKARPCRAQTSDPSSYPTWQVERRRRWQLELSARPMLRPPRDTCSRHSIPGRPVIGDLSRKNINNFRCFAQNFSARKVFCAAGSCASTR